MKTKVVAQDDVHQPYITDLLNTILLMQKTSSYTDCTLICSDGTPVPAHLPMLSISWPRLEHLLPPSDGLCSCQCCVPGIAISGEAETVQAVLELAYTGRTGLLGVERERKVKQLLQVLGIEWQLERVENEFECNNNKSSKEVHKLTESLTIPSKHKSDSPNKESLEDGMLISPVDAKVIVEKSLCNFSIDEDVLIVNDRRKSIPREVKTKKPVSDSKSPGLIEKNEGRKCVQPRQPNEKTAVKDNSTRPLQFPLINQNNDHVNVVGPNRELDIDHSSEIVKSLPEIKRTASKEKGISLYSVQVTESVAAIKKTMIAPGTLMTKVDSCLRFFCSYCEVEMTKFTNAEKETHWAVVHFSEQLSKFTHNGNACNVQDCNMKVETGEEMVKHVGVFHKKIYNFLLFLPPKVPDKAKQSPVQKPSKLLNPSSKFNSRVVSVKPGNQLKAPVFFIECTLLNPQAYYQFRAPNHLTKAVIEEGTVLSESISSRFPVTNQRWYYTCFSSNKNPNLPVLTSLVSHYSSMLGEEDPAKCPFCPHLKEQHSRLGLYQSEEELASAEGKYWCGVCYQQLVSEELFQHHLATHLMTCLGKPGSEQGSGEGSNGRKDFHVFFNTMGTSDPEIRIRDDSTDINNVGEIMKEEISSDSGDSRKCNICEKVLSCPQSLKRHTSLIHSKGSFMRKPDVNLDDIGIVIPGSVQNKDFDACERVINTKVNDDLLETSRLGYALNDKKSQRQVEKKGCEALKNKSKENEFGEVMPACIICNMTFSSITRVKSHLALCHFKEKIMREMTSDLNCALCDRAFQVNSVLVMHVGCYHNRSETYLEEYMDSPVEKKDFEAVMVKSKEESESEENKPACIICNMTFSSNYRVKSHLAACHFKEKIMQEMTSELVCDLCDRAFFKNSELVIHVGCYHNRSEAYMNEYMEFKKQMEIEDDQVSESDVLIASFEDEINLNSSAGFVESEDILSFFAQP